MDAQSIAYRALELGAMQKQDELAQLLQLLSYRRPRRVLEIGAFMGGTLYAWRELGAEVWAIDQVVRENFNDHGAHVLIADSHQPATFLEMKELVGEGVDLLFIDGDHRYEGVKRDLYWYRTLVSSGGLVALHDIALSADPNLEVWRLWREQPAPKREILRQPKNWGGIGLLEV